MPLALLREEDLTTLEGVRQDLPILAVHEYDALRVTAFDETD
jgi:hypothetical protein